VKSKSNESGPSGGLITTLSIYDALIKKDLTKGYKIVGTGTISDDGTVGEIGSVTFKLASAVKDKADIFLCPKENYKDATKYAKKHKYDIIIKEVASFDEAVDYLNKLEEK
jgi:PDZ domain-containing protein